MLLSNQKCAQLYGLCNTYAIGCACGSIRPSVCGGELQTDMANICGLEYCDKVLSALLIISTICQLDVKSSSYVNLLLKT